MTSQVTFKDDKLVKSMYSWSDEGTLRSIIAPNGDYIEDDYYINSWSAMVSPGRSVDKHNKPYFRPCGDLNIARIKEMIGALSD